jgi:hypothetical protein
VPLLPLARDRASVVENVLLLSGGGAVLLWSNNGFTHTLAAHVHALLCARIGRASHMSSHVSLRLRTGRVAMRHGATGCAAPHARTAKPGMK